MLLKVDFFKDSLQQSISKNVATKKHTHLWRMPFYRVGHRRSRSLTECINIMSYNFVLKE
jgi:hypothetical protein